MMKDKKQETIEEAAESRYGTDMDSIRGSSVYDLNTDLKRGFIEGAKWQYKRIGWIDETIEKPPFGVLVLVKCRIYGRFLASYEHIGDFAGEQYGNWRDFNNNLGILPPTHWMHIPE